MARSFHSFRCRLRRVSSPLPGAYNSATPAPSRAPQNSHLAEESPPRSTYTTSLCCLRRIRNLLFPGVGVVGCRNQHRFECRMVLDRSMDESVDLFLRAVDVQLLEQKGKGLFQIGGYRAAYILGQRPQFPLERPDGFLPRLIVELLLGIAALAFTGCVLIEPPA